MNDGAAIRRGRFWAGTMAIDERARSGIALSSRSDGRVTPDDLGRDDLERPRVERRHRRMFYVDSPTQRIDVFDFDLATGAVGNGGCSLHSVEDGIPDGLAIDVDDGVWVALWGGGRLHRYTRDGVLDRVVRLPVTCPTRCAFGGPELDELFVTSAWRALTEDEREAQPHAGGIIG